MNGGTPAREWKRGDKVMVSRFTGQERKLIGPAKVLAVADGYAMVRRPRAMPFVASLKDLRDV